MTLHHYIRAYQCAPNEKEKERMIDGIRLSYQKEHQLYFVIDENEPPILQEVSYDCTPEEKIEYFNNALAEYEENMRGNTSHVRTDNLDL